jgi:hypothetical protein
MKVERKIYKGIEYVLVADLPQTQREQLLQTLSQDHFIKILIEGTVVSHCLQFKDYSLWFDNVFNSRTQPVQEPVTEKINLATTRLALNKV